MVLTAIPQPHMISSSIIYTIFVEKSDVKNKKS